MRLYQSAIEHHNVVWTALLLFKWGDLSRRLDVSTHQRMVWLVHVNSSFYCTLSHLLSIRQFHWTWAWSGGITFVSIILPSILRSSVDITITDAWRDRHRLMKLRRQRPRGIIIWPYSPTKPIKTRRIHQVVTLNRFRNPSWDDKSLHPWPHSLRHHGRKDQTSGGAVSFSPPTLWSPGALSPKPWARR